MRSDLKASLAVLNVLRSGRAQAMRMISQIRIGG